MFELEIQIPMLSCIYCNIHFIARVPRIRVDDGGGGGGVCGGKVQNDQNVYHNECVVQS